MYTNIVPAGYEGQCKKGYEDEETACEYRYAYI